MPKLEITNMVMIQNPDNDQVIVQERVKSWFGISFPGGHTENGESVYDSAVREIKEETGLNIKNLKACGFMYWFNNKTEDKYFTYFYKTTDYSGELLESTDEGKVFWTNLDELDGMRLAPNFKEYLPVFLNDQYSEAYCSWNEDMKPDMTKENPWGIQYSGKCCLAETAALSDIPGWLDLVMVVADDFPGLDLVDYTETLKKNILRKTALCVKQNGKIVGILLFSTNQHCLSCMAVHPDYRRFGIASALVSEMLCRMPDGDVHVTTFREGDTKGVAPRALYQRFGFEAEELLIEFDYPVQRFVLHRQ